MSNQKLTLYFLIILFTCASAVVFPCRSGETIEGLRPGDRHLSQEVKAETIQQPSKAESVHGSGSMVHGSTEETINGKPGTTNQLKVLPKIAILPFENLSGQFGAPSQVMADIERSLQKEFSIVPERQMENILTELRVRHTGFLPTEQINEIGKRLKVDTILLGIIDTYRQQPLPQVSFFCNMVSTKKGAPILWSKYFCAVGKEKVYLLQRDNRTTWSSIMQSVTEDLLRSLPKIKER